MLVLISMMNTGGECMFFQGPASAPQRRVQATVLDCSLRFLRGAGSDVGGESAIREMLREGHHYSGGGPTPTLPLGLKAGVPDSAGAVDLARVLEAFDPTMADQVKDPGALLLPPRLRPHCRARVFTRLGPDYEDYVHRNVRVGLQRLVGPRGVARKRKRRVVAGAFAVGKDELEDRAISAVLDANDSIDPRKLPRPRFEFIPALKAFETRGPPRKLHITKRDARHYFHQLALPRRWHRWLGHPPIKVHGKRRWPLQKSVPMGFGPAAGWAQGATDAASAKANLDQDLRVVEGRPVPLQPPIWGSILDDLWFLEEAEKGEVPEWGLEQAEKVTDAWALHGTTVNRKKDVNRAVGAEIQGVHVDGDTHDVGMSPQKRRSLACGML